MSSIQQMPEEVLEPDRPQQLPTATIIDHASQPTVDYDSDATLAEEVKGSDGVDNTAGDAGDMSIDSDNTLAGDEITRTQEMQQSAVNMDGDQVSGAENIRVLSLKDLADSTEGNVNHLLDCTADNHSAMAVADDSEGIADADTELETRVAGVTEDISYGTADLVDLEVHPGAPDGAMSDCSVSDFIAASDLLEEEGVNARRATTADIDNGPDYIADSSDSGGGNVGARDAADGDESMHNLSLSEAGADVGPLQDSTDAKLTNVECQLPAVENVARMAQSSVHSEISTAQMLTTVPQAVATKECRVIAGDIVSSARGDADGSELIMRVVRSFKDDSEQVERLGHLVELLARPCKSTPTLSEMSSEELRDAAALMLAAMRTTSSTPLTMDEHTLSLVLHKYLLMHGLVKNIMQAA